MAPSHKLVLSAFAVSLAFFASGHQTKAEDFRVDNVVHAENQKETKEAKEKAASSESTTVFCDGMVYDFMKDPAETIVFDGVAKRVWVLNEKDRTRAELTTDEIADLVDQSRPVAAKSPEPLVKFLANPQFEERADEESGELTLRSTLVTYRLLLQEGTPEMVEQYRQFSDWSARLNSLLTPGARPPFGRLAVNAALAQRQAIASKVSLTLSTGKGMKPQHMAMRSEHRIITPLTQDDLARIAEARKATTDFKLLSFVEYRKAEMR